MTDPDHIGPAKHWQWCTACGNLWATGRGVASVLCSCDSDDTELFPDPQAAEAVYRVGGGAAVWTIERHLYFGWRKFRMGR